MRIFIVHGYSAGPEEHWFPWLAAKLSAQGHRVDVVELPTPDAPIRSEWEAAIARTVSHVDADTVIVAHSLGGISVLRYLDSLAGDWRLGGLVLVSGFQGALAALPELDAYLAEPLDVTELPSHIGAITAIHSDDDQFVPPAQSTTLAAALGATEVLVPGAGHFLGADGHTELAAAFDEVQKIVGS